MKQKYTRIRFRSASMALIETANQVVDAYRERGIMLTVRALYYRMVARNAIENNKQSYKRFARLINDARLGGLVDWDVIEDITRSFRSPFTIATPKKALRNAANGYNEDLWRDQEHRAFVIIEKDAMLNIVEPACQTWQVPLMSARGYPSSTSLREFAQTLLTRGFLAGKHLHIYHLGDHDPSGMDMTRDLKERISMFFDYKTIDLERIALNIDQVNELDLPENPTKAGDARFEGYAEKFGDACWELDALPPEYVQQLIEDRVQEFVDMDKWTYNQCWIDYNRDLLLAYAEQYEE